MIAMTRTAALPASVTRPSGRLVRWTLGLALLVGVLPLAIGATQAPAIAASDATVYVSPSGSDGNPGTSSAPFRTLSKAVQVAPSGSTVQLGAGIYHESVQVYGKDLDIVGAAGQKVVLDGARRLDGWREASNGWYVTGWNVDLSRTYGDMIDPRVPMAAYPDQAFIDGAPLRQVARLGDLASGTFFVDQDADRLYIGSNPSGRTVEASDLRWAIYFNRAHGSSLRNVTVRRYASTAADMAAVRAYSDDMVVADSTFELNAYMGVSAMGSNITFRNLVAQDNAYIGVHGHLAPQFTLRDSLVQRNNGAGFDAWHSGSGVKVTTSRVVNYWNNEVSDNKGPGLWVDLGVAFGSIVGNLVERNTYSGILVELSGKTVVADNVVLDSGQAGVWVLESNDVEVWNNALYRNDRDIWVEDGPRVDPSANSDAISELLRVSLRNNTMGQGRSGVQASLATDDWTEKRSSVDMRISSDWNAFWLPAGTPTKLSRWARWPQSLAISATLDTHRSITGQDGRSIWSTATTNPYARNTAGYDLRSPSSLTLGANATATVAAALGVEPGTRLPIGPLNVRIPRRSATTQPPSTQPPTTQPPSTQPPTTQPPATQPTNQPPTAAPMTALDGYEGYSRSSGRHALTDVRTTPKGTATFRAAGNGDVPTNAQSVVMTVTATGVSKGGRIIAHACGTPRPSAISLVFAAGRPTSNVVVSDIGADGRVCLFTGQAVILDVDVTGWILPRRAYNSVKGSRVFDSRPTGATVDGRYVGSARLASGSLTTVKVTGRAGVPSGVEAVVVTLVSRGVRRAGGITVIACNTSPSVPADQQAQVGRITTSLAVAPVDSAGNICIRSTAETHLLVHVVGWLR
jgi:hypothetical protein